MGKGEEKRRKSIEGKIKGNKRWEKGVEMPHLSCSLTRWVAGKRSKDCFLILTYLLTYLLTFLFTHATPRSASASLNVCVQHKQLNG